MKILGSNYKNRKECEFAVWAPFLSGLSVQVLSDPPQIIQMHKDALGYWTANAPGLAPGTLYTYLFPDGKSRPDPASHSQPEGAFGPSAIIDHSEFKWSDAQWRGVPLNKMLIYELHTGTFSEQGTFEAMLQKLPHLEKLGVNTIELMPVGQFPGKRNWGYDGVFPFAPQDSYGGPLGLKKLVDGAHRRGFAVILDVVYNHFGPEANIVQEFMPCFTDKYKTPWGNAINFDDRYSWGIRDFFIQNACFWLKNYHIDALRLDAIHGIYDLSAKHFLRELSENVSELSTRQGRKLYLIAESDLNDAKVITKPDKGGWGLDAQWNDDFHHSLHALLTQEKRSYYEDFGKVCDLAKAIKEGFVYSWNYSQFRKRFYGGPLKDPDSGKLIVYSQDHDQIGNRPNGERLSHLIPLEGLKLAAAAVILSPYIPMIFMGEEYAESSPFLYFADFSEPALMENVRKGRNQEMKNCGYETGSLDPCKEEAFLRSKLKWADINEAKHKEIFLYYQRLIQIRKEMPSLFKTGRDLKVKIDEKRMMLFLIRREGKHQAAQIYNFNQKKIALPRAPFAKKWKKILDSSDKKWLGPGTTNESIINPLSYRLYTA